ncbi:MAG: hypothetical protein Fur002_22380 [Anaerolineales bacterium]
MAGRVREFGGLVRDKSLPQCVEALRAIGESASADFHELSKGFIPLVRDKSLPQCVEALRAIGESALADFHGLSKIYPAA